MKYTLITILSAISLSGCDFSSAMNSNPFKKEIIDNTPRVSVSLINNKRIVSINDSKLPLTKITLSGELVKVELKQITKLKSFFPVKLICSEDNTNYLMIDKNLIPFMVEDYNNSKLYLKIGQYELDKPITFNVYTKRLTEFVHDGNFPISHECIIKPKPIEVPVEPKKEEIKDKPKKVDITKNIPAPINNTPTIDINLENNTTDEQHKTENKPVISTTPSPVVKIEQQEEHKPVVKESDD